MSDAALAHGGGHGHSSTGLSNPKLAMWLFLGSDCLLFGGLISTYMLYRNKSSDGPTPGEFFDIPFTSATSFVLLASSLTMVLAVSSMMRGDRAKSRLWILTTAALGSLFIAGQIFEFTEFHAKGMGFTTNLFTSSFFTLTGFHGVHVTMGIIMLLATYFIMEKQGWGRERGEAVEIIGLYWHFVDIVWIIIFTLIYLIPA
jgi:heme/copper-type cytochrome/quinol oxidase subunit 3